MAPACNPPDCDIFHSGIDSIPDHPGTARIASRTPFLTHFNPGPILSDAYAQSKFRRPLEAPRRRLSVPLLQVSKAKPNLFLLHLFRDLQLCLLQALLPSLHSMSKMKTKIRLTRLARPLQPRQKKTTCTHPHLA